MYCCDKLERSKAADELDKDLRSKTFQPSQQRLHSRAPSPAQYEEMKERVTPPLSRFQRFPASTVKLLHNAEE